MTPDFVAQILAYGIIMGALYGLASVGFTLVFGVMRVLNVAHGAFMMIGGYLSFWGFTLYHIDPFVSLLLVGPSLFLIGLIFYIVQVFPVIKFTDDHDKINTSLLISFGLSVVLENVALLLWTGDIRSITGTYTENVFEIFKIRIPLVGIVGIGLAVLFVFALYLFLIKTRFGKSIRATAADWKAASLMGINTNRVYLISFALGVALAGIAGTLICVIHSIDPYIGLFWTLKGMIIITVAGVGNIRGVLACGLLLGIVESLSVFIAGASYREVAGLIILVIVLMVKPKGLFTTKVRGV
ncbi:MAG: branched-chain amino acid ABC transporter permease [Thermodesulfobacteriota bacterium]